MRILSNGSFDPLCPSPLVVANAHTLRPRPVLYQDIILGSLDNGGMNCEPCIQAGFQPNTYLCICGCFEFDLPQLFEGGGDSNFADGCDLLTAATAPRTCRLTQVGGQCGVHWPFAIHCLWQYVEGDYYDHTPIEGEDFKIFTLDSLAAPAANGEATLSIVIQKTEYPGSGSLRWIVAMLYRSSNFTASGGTFDLVPGFVSTSIVGGCTGGAPTWNIPNTVSVRGVPCS